ncbi:hypothetical protein SAMN05192562_10553 [Kosakonia arachidis]|uniref:Uncharacterized protein n=1 Tax=Kosakonia arachidis TaxID=551989 RepID=A0A1I7DGN9_9ENTR|nr:hypothetical protein SAMN05192562_10553 [Kosakonia arachidis]
MSGEGTIPMDESLLECDLDWFGVAPDGSLAHFATAVSAPFRRRLATLLPTMNGFLTISLRCNRCQILR